MGTPVFRDPEGAARTLARIEAATGMRVPGYFDSALAVNPDPDLALTNLERWLASTGNPSVHFEQMAGFPLLGQRLLGVLGASRPLADALIQNPELASLVLEPGQLNVRPNMSRILEEGRRLIAKATSFTHALDRIRFLRQRWTLPIVLNDLADEWTQEFVWSSLSTLADSAVELAAETVWRDQGARRGLPEECPVMIVGFGKLGGGELNYSSDIDLVYASRDGLEEGVSRACGKFCEALGRALSEKMGRGSLYRVDLRLRPYGNAGPILPSMRAVESYYNLYAEPWEVQALLRSRPITGPVDLTARWEEMRIRTCFRPKLSEMALDEMLSMRTRMEAGAAPNDIKRAPGGIRDVEFLVQIHQLTHGFHNPSLQTPATCPAIRNLDVMGLVEHPVAVALIEAYTFLRKLEHRIQLVADLQTHAIPEGEGARTTLARTMGFDSWARLEPVLEKHRRTIQTLSLSSVSLGSVPDVLASANRSAVAQALEGQAAAGLQWFDVLPAAAAFYDVLASEPSGLRRVREILLRAPFLVPSFKASVALTELLVSGEIDGLVDPVERIRALPLDSPIPQVAEAIHAASAILLAQWSLADAVPPTDEVERAPASSLGRRLADLFDAALVHCRQRLYAEFDVVATGSYGAREMGPSSDADLILLVPSKDRQSSAEQQAQHLLELVGRLKRLGAPITVDLRLRPEGGKGLLVRTYEGFRAYDLDGMEMWERFALGNSRLLAGEREALSLVRRSGYELPLSPERLRELLRMKRRVETERVMPQHVHRDVKLGSGGLSDVEWLVHLHEMRYPDATGAGRESEPPPMDGRIRRMARFGLINALEAQILREAWVYLSDLRTRIFLQGLPDDLMPENPDRLSRLAAAMGIGGPNELLAKHRSVTDTVRRLFLEGVDRLRP